MSISKIFASAIALSIVMIVIVQAALTLPAGATGGPRGHRKVVICHATNSHQNPYTVNKVDKSSIDEVNNQYLNGHGDHNGPVWYSGIADHSWGDIIPPFTNDAGNSYPGQNWNAAGKAIYENGCKFKAPAVTPETPTTPAPVNGGGNGGGNVLAASTNTATLAPTGASMLLNFTVGSALLAAVAATIRPSLVQKLIKR